MFRPRLAPTLALALAVPLFCRLGLWQLDRADQKRELATTLAERARLPPARIDGPIQDPEALRYRRIEARGRYLSDKQVLIEGRREGGETGFDVLTPLAIEGSDRLLLVDRGFVPADVRGNPAPAPVPEGLIEIAGEADIPSAPWLSLYKGHDPARDWGQRWPYVTLDLFATTIDRPLVPVMMRLGPDAPGGFLRHWERPPVNVAMHLGYAIQWFAFAAIAVAIYIRLGLVRTPKEETQA